MAWYETSRIYNVELYGKGITRLNGNALSNKYTYPEYGGKVFPAIKFPSGQEFELRINLSSGRVDVHLTAGIQLGLYSNIDHAIRQLDNFENDDRTLFFKRIQPKISNQESLLIGCIPNKRLYRVAFEDSGIVDIAYIGSSNADLLTLEVQAILPQIEVAQERGENAIVPFKFYSGEVQASWYPVAFDGVDTFYGLITATRNSLGTFRLSELETLSNDLKVPIVRDFTFVPRTLSKLVRTEKLADITIIG